MALSRNFGEGERKKRNTGVGVDPGGKGSTKPPIMTRAEENFNGHGDKKKEEKGRIGSGGKGLRYD